MEINVDWVETVIAMVGALAALAGAFKAGGTREKRRAWNALFDEVARSVREEGGRK